jgi:DNA repair ATPase RecN
MARIRKIEVSNFRCIKNLTWLPSSWLNCLVGLGDSGKSTLIDAIDLCLGARRSVQFGPATVLCRSFDHLLCSKGDEPWAQAGRMNFAKMRCG